MQLSSNSVLQNVQNLASQGNYVAAYQAVLNDLNTQNPNPSAADKDVLNWLQTAINVNSGATTLDAIAVRANNVAAVEYEKGYSINMFGPEQQIASNMVAQAFFNSIPSNGTIQNIKAIATLDATNGLSSLGVSNAAWAGALPSGYNMMLGFNSYNYYNDQLNASQQLEADRLHVVAADITGQYESALKLGVPDNVKDAMVSNIAAEANTSSGIVTLASGLYNGAAAVLSNLQTEWAALGAVNLVFSSLQSALNNLNSGSVSGASSLQVLPNASSAINNANSVTFNEVNNNQASIQQIVNSNNVITDTASGANAGCYINNATVTFAANSWGTVWGNGNFATVSSGGYAGVYGNNNTTLLQAGAVGSTIAGNDCYVSDGTGVGFILSGGTGNSVNLGGYTFAQSVASFNAATNMMVDRLSNGSTLDVASGAQAVFAGGDGTLIANDNYRLLRLAG